ncbi:MAG TPA: PIN domain-containing protein [Vicinamibacteria bacterium]|nr:PIN domain-containing protein [Vicinamibacteria bacterium]
MPAEFFLDTNVFVYTFDASAPKKRARARELVRAALMKGAGAISWQVAQEFLNVALHRFERPLTPREAVEYLDDVLAPLCQVYPSGQLLRDALAIHTETGYHFYDCLIVAGASASGARILFTEDLQSDREVWGLRIQDPFA